MATRYQGTGVIITYNTEQQSPIVLPPEPSPAISPRLDRFDLVTKTWTKRKNMNDARCGFAMHSANDYLYAIGGTDGAKILDSVEEYDIFTDTWEYKAKMPTARCFFNSVEQDGYVYCIGGLTVNAQGTTSISRKVERYDTITDTWMIMADLPAGYGVMMGVAHVIDHQIYILSGYKSDFGTYLDRVLIYHIDSNTWEVGDQLSPEELTMFRRLLPFSFVENDMIYVVNGLYYEVPEPITDEDGKVIRTPDPIIQYQPDAYKFDINSGVVFRGEQDFIDIPRARYSGTTNSIGNTHYFLGGIGKVSNTMRVIETVNVSGSPFAYEDFARLLRGRSSQGSVAYVGDYGEAIFVSGGVISNQNENFLRVEVDAVPKRVRLDGKQSCNVEINVFDENEEAPAEVKVRLQVKGTDDIVLFTSDEIIVKNGHAIATILPRCDDANGGVTMKDDTVRSYSINVSGSVIDKVFYGDTSALPQTGGGGNGTTGPTGPNTNASVTLPGQYQNPVVFDTVNSPEETTSGGYLSTNLSTLGGFLALRPSVNGGGKDTTIEFYSDIRWLPQVTPIIESNDGDYEEIRSSLDRLSRELPFGGSPVMDAIYRGAEIVDFDVSGVKKMIYVLTDGKENCSHNNFNDVLSKVNSLSGVGKTPIVSSQFRVVPGALYLDQGIREGSTELEYLARETNASSLYVATDQDVDESIRSLLRAKGFIGFGLFTFEVDLGENALIESIRANFDIPDAFTDAFWRYSVGDDDRKFTLLTDRVEANEQIELTDINGRFIKFVAEFSASMEHDEYVVEKIVPPVLTSVEIVYHKKTESYIYLKPHQTEGDPSQVVITLDATRPNGSEILLGVNDNITGTWDDYNSPSAPAVENNSRIVLPIRKSLDNSTYTLEKLVSVDGFIFETTYGKWAQDCTVIIYKDGTDVIPESEYKLIPHKGRVVFAYKTNDNYVISIQNAQRLSVAAKVVNRVHGKPIQITGAGYMYSTITNKSGIGGTSIVPEATNLLITPLQPNPDSIFRANYTYSDLRGRPEQSADKGGTLITWYVNDAAEIDIQNLKQWDNKDYKIVKPGDVVYFTVEPATLNGGALLLGRKTRSLPVTVA